ncbi:MAG: RNA-directed DNA polymerase [Pseudomonadales bacterium]|nr:RNA-directed DNA polymerase [Pseudomonadales bacterium]
MLKQVFDKEQLQKVVSTADVWRWDIISKYGGVEAAVAHIVRLWETNHLAISPLDINQANGKTVFVPSCMEDAFAIKLLDRFIRQIYKVRQSDRNRIVRQIATLLKDSGDYCILRLDIKDFYESISFKSLIQKFEDDMILAPSCLNLLKTLLTDMSARQTNGLPRGTTVSPTLAELYLEGLDKKIAAHSDVIFGARYVDDIILLVPFGQENVVENFVSNEMKKQGLALNFSPQKYHKKSSRTAKLDYLGYSISVNWKEKKPNSVTLKISQPKLNKLKAKIILSILDFAKNDDFGLLKKRIVYLSVLKVVRRGKNGNLLAGLAHNYQYVTNGYNCLKSIDGFLCHNITNPRFNLTQPQQNAIKKISFYGNSKQRKVGNFSKKMSVKIMRVWKNA